MQDTDVSDSYRIAPLPASCVLDAVSGLVLSWDLQSAHNYVDIQLEGYGQGWISGGLVNDNGLMVTTPVHKVLIYDYLSGQSSFVAMGGYDARSFSNVTAWSVGVIPLLLQGAQGKLFMRYRQRLDTADVAIDLDKTSNFMYAWAPMAYPAMHTIGTTIQINWSTGTCFIPPEKQDVEGYILLLLPFFAIILTWTALRHSHIGHLLTQQRLGRILPELPSWVHTLTFYSMNTLFNLKYGEVMMILAYVVIQLILFAHWTTESGATSIRSAGSAFGKIALTNLMMAFLPISKTSLWVYIMEIPFERAVKFHRFLTNMAMLCMLLHFIFSGMAFARSWYVSTNVGCICLIHHTLSHTLSYEKLSYIHPHTGVSDQALVVSW